MKRFKKELLYTFMFSLITSALLIIHGLFFDLDFSQIQRITIKGFVLTFILTFIALNILEKIFNLEEHEEITKIKKRLSKLEKRRYIKD